VITDILADMFAACYLTIVPLIIQHLNSADVRKAVLKLSRWKKNIFASVVCPLCKLQGTKSDNGVPSLGLGLWSETVAVLGFLVWRGVTLGTQRELKCLGLLENFTHELGRGHN